MVDAMTKSELIERLASKNTRLSSRDVGESVKAVLDAMTLAMATGSRIEIRGFGSFKVKEYGSYAGRNPRTGEKVAVEPKRLPFFRAGKELKEYLNA